MKKLQTYLIASLLFTFAFYSCDKVKENDLIQPGTVKTTIYSPTSGPSLVDLAALSKNGIIEVKISQNAQNGKVSIEQNKWLKYTPAEAFSKGEDQFVLSLNNNEITFKVIVGSIPDTVCNIGAQYDKIATNTARPYEIDVLANDVFCSGIKAESLTITSAPEHGQATIGNNKITYTSLPGFEGEDKLIYSVSSNDTSQGSASAEVWIYVFNPDVCHPGLAPDDFTTSVNTSVTIDVLGNDNLCTTISPATLYISEQPKNGTIAIVEGKLFYTPSAGYSGYEYFSYALVDDQGNFYPVPVKGYIQ